MKLHVTGFKKAGITFKMPCVLKNQWVFSHEEFREAIKFDLQLFIWTRKRRKRVHMKGAIQNKNIFETK